MANFSYISLPKDTMSSVCAMRTLCFDLEGRTHIVSAYTGIPAMVGDMPMYLCTATKWVPVGIK